MTEYKSIAVRFALLITLALVAASVYIVAAKKIVTFDASGITSAVALNR